MQASSSNIKKIRSDIARYQVLRTVQSARHFTSLADVFNRTLSQILLEASSHMLHINARKLVVHISTTVYCQIFIYTAE